MSDLRRCALAIGVSRAGSLPWLMAASRGARAFHTWATEHGYDAVLLDDAEARVTRQAVEDAVTAFVESGDVGQLLIYFAGHGFLKSAETEFWLLSGAPEKSAEAVNLSLSLAHARRCGIPHVAFFSDACRSATPSSRFAGVSGGSIFPNVDLARATLDVLYATEPGFSAWEFPADEVSGRYEAVFTQALLEAVRGEVPQVVEAHEAPPWVIHTHRLGTWLSPEVTVRAAAADPKVRQVPDVRAESHPPLFLTEVPGFEGPAVPPQRTVPVRERFETGLEAYDSLVDAFTGELSDWKVFAPRVGRGLLPAVYDLHAVDGSPAGALRVVGAEVERVGIPGTPSVPRQADGSYLLAPAEPTTAVIRLASGPGAVVAVHPSAGTSVVVRDGRIAQVGFTDTAPSMVRTAAAVLSMEGIHRSLGPVSGDVDPTVAILDAAEHFLAGEPTALATLASRLAGRGFLPFDVAWLAGVDGPIAPFCPMATRTWWLREPADPWLAELRTHLLPSLWSTFDAEGTQMLFDALEASP